MGEARQAHRVIAVLGGKGGVGCTFVALNLATLAARNGQLTALVDAAPQRRQLAVALGLETGDATASVVQRGELLGTMLPGPDGMHVLATATVSPELVRDHLRVLFDVVLVDCGSGEDTGIARAADDVLMISAMTRTSLLEAARRLEQLETHDVRCHCVLNRTEPGGDVDAAAAAALLGHAVMASLPYDPALVMASLHGTTPLVSSQPDSHLARRLARLAATLRIIPELTTDDTEPGEPVAHLAGRRVFRPPLLRFGRR
jgi:MinD-like ATPase involved in chromosome partitioning or flagellar assembly